MGISYRNSFTPLQLPGADRSVFHQKMSDARPIDQLIQISINARLCQYLFRTMIRKPCIKLRTRVNERLKALKTLQAACRSVCTSAVRSACTAACEILAHPLIPAPPTHARLPALIVASASGNDLDMGKRYRLTSGHAPIFSLFPFFGDRKLKRRLSDVRVMVVIPV